jgi:tRNA uridine 5-carboxymethylaminomethyl modification enzyme
VTPSRETLELLEAALGIRIGEPTSLHKLLQRRDLEADGVFSNLAPEIAQALTREELSALLSRIRYDGYIKRELERIERLRPFESRLIPPGFPYASIPGLSREVVEKCAGRRPRTVGEASRIPGVTPAAVAIISAHVAKGAGTASSGAIPGAPDR